MIKRIPTLFLLIFSLASSLLSQTNSVQIDFGNVISPSPWNNITNPHNGETQLIDLLGQSPGITLTVIDSFNFINTNGTLQASANLGIPSTATSDSFYGNLVEFADDTQPTGGVRLSNLDPSIQYTLKIFASRLATDNRETLYTLSGIEELQFSLDAANNEDMIIETTLTPNVDGIIDLTATAGPNNTNTNGFYYLGAVIVDFPDPDFEQSLSLLSPNGGEYWQVGKDVDILFSNSVTDPTLLDYSIDNGQNWNAIDILEPFTTSYNWTVPNTVSEQCLIRMTSFGLQEVSNSVFTITDDQDSCPIVVIGSSTAEGIGATVQDSAWVYRYEAELYQNDTRYPVINLGRGGYTTYHLLPSESTSGAAVGIIVDTEKNITKALSFNPSNIIINLPSNDAANNFPVSDQMDNFREMTSAAAAEGVSTWVCTTQPRNFGNQDQIALQIEGRDSILNYYGDMALDFWNGVADENGNILSIYNSGDGVHLNNAGHNLLFEKVLSQNIPSTTDCASTGTSVNDLNNESEASLFSLSPNPAHSDVNLRFSTIVSGEVTLSLTNIDGKTLNILNETMDKIEGDTLTILASDIRQLDNDLIYVKLQVKTKSDKIYSETQPLIFNQR